MLLHPINDDLIRIRLPSLTKKFDENKIKDVDGCIVLNKIDLLQRAQKYTKISFSKYFILFQ
jgi:ribosome biogenesis GTPase A